VHDADSQSVSHWWQIPGVQWYIVEKAAANVLYAGTDAVKSVRRMLRTKEVGVAEMSHCLPG